MYWARYVFVDQALRGGSMRSSYDVKLPFFLVMIKVVKLQDGVKLQANPEVNALALITYLRFGTRGPQPEAICYLRRNDVQHTERFRNGRFPFLSPRGRNDIMDH